MVACLAQPGMSAAAVDPLSGQSIHSTTADLVGIAPRRTGSVGGKAAADYVQKRFTGAGLDRVYVEEVIFYDW